MPSGRHEFEEAFRETVGAPAARAFGRGREALLVLLKALGVGEGDRVGVAAFTCLSVVEPILLAGAAPVYLDVDEYACIDPASLAGVQSGSLKVVILQHTFGVPGRLDELMEACRKIGATVIEDCAHAFGSSWEGTPLGRFGEAAIFSTGWGKPFSTVRGGVVTANSTALLDKLDAEAERLAAAPCAGTELLLALERCAYGTLSGLGCALAAKRIYLDLCRRGIVPETYELRGKEFLRRGYVKWMGERTARAGLRELERWPALMARRRENTEFARRRFAEASLPPWPVPCRADATMLAWPTLVADKPDVLAWARRMHVDVDGWYESPVAPLSGHVLHAAGYELGSCPWGEEIARHVVHVPTDSPVFRATLDALVARLMP